MMAERGLLSLHRVEEFASWAEGIGYKREGLKGEYDVLRLRKPSGKGVIVFYARARAREHATVTDDGVKLVLRWLRSRGEDVREDEEYMPRSQRPL